MWSAGIGAVGVWRLEEGGAVVWCVLNSSLDYALLSRERVKRTQESSTIKWSRVWCVWRGVNATRVPLQCDCAVLCPSPLLPSRGGPSDRTLNQTALFVGKCRYNGSQPRESLANPSSTHNRRSEANERIAEWSETLLGTEFQYLNGHRR